MEAVAVSRKCVDWRGTLETIGRKILVREVALPGIRHVLATRRQFVAPGEFRAVESAARRKFPFGFGRQFLPGPFGIGFDIPAGAGHDRVAIETADVAAPPMRTPSAGARTERPPLTAV